MTCNDCVKYPGCMERSREYICREFKYDGGIKKAEAKRIYDDSAAEKGKHTRKQNKAVRRTDKI